MKKIQTEVTTRKNNRQMLRIARYGADMQKAKKEKEEKQHDVSGI